MSKFQEYLEAAQSGHFIEIDRTDDEAGDSLAQKISSALHRNKFGVDEFYSLPKKDKLRYKFFNDKVFERAKDMFKDLGIKYKEISSWEKEKNKDGIKIQCPSCTYNGKMIKENPFQHKCPKCHTLFGGAKS